MVKPIQNIFKYKRVILITCGCNMYSYMNSTILVFFRNLIIGVFQVLKFTRCSMSAVYLHTLSSF